jgi:transmembrane sensor
LKDINKIWKFLQRQLSSEEQQSLQEWKDISEENHDLFNDIQNIWSHSEQLEEIQLFDAENAWAEIEGDLEENQKPGIRRIQWVGIAASFLLLAASIIWFYPKNEKVIVEPIYQTYTAIDQDSELTLADSTIVHLKKGSAVKYFTRIDESFKERRVWLSGQGTFDIAPNDSLPFIVEVGKAGIKVLGTIFKVENRDSNDIAVENIEGLIKFYELLDETNAVTLKKGEKFIFDGEGFVDKTSRVEKKIIKPVEKYYTIQELWYNLVLNFENKIKIESYGSYDPEAKIKINLIQSPRQIIKALESNPKVKIEYIKTCPDCFEIKTLNLIK